MIIIIKVMIIIISLIITGVRIQCDEWRELACWERKVESGRGWTFCLQVVIIHHGDDDHDNDDNDYDDHYADHDENDFDF